MSMPEDAQPAPGTPSAEERQWAMFAHLSILIGGLVTAGWAGSLGAFIGPLVIWLVKKDTMPFVADQAKEALNFSIMVSALMFILFVLTMLTLGLLFFITIPLALLVSVVALVFLIIAAIKANEGVAYRYPFNVRLVN